MAARPAASPLASARAPELAPLQRHFEREGEGRAEDRGEGLQVQVHEAMAGSAGTRALPAPGARKAYN